MAKAPKLGEILVRLGYLTPARLDAVLMHQRQWGVSLGRAAVAKNFCTEAQVLDALGMQLSLPVMDLDKEELTPALAAELPQKDAEKHHAVPVRLSGARGEVLVVAMAAPATPSTQDAVRAVARKGRLQVFLANDEAVHRAIGRIYRGESYNVIPEGAILGNREQLLDPSTLENAAAAGEPAPLAPPAPRAPEADAFMGLSLTSECRQVINYGAEVRKTTPRAIIERVLEDWAARQREAWARSKG